MTAAHPPVSKGPPSEPSRAGDALFDGLLSAIRRHTRMDVAFVSEIASGRRHFRHVQSAPGAPPHPIVAGGSDPLEDSLCARLVDGSVPPILGDAGAHPATRDMPIVRTAGIAAHLGVPIRLSDGRLYGTLCCFSSTARDSLDERDLGMMRVFADIVAEQIDRQASSVRATDTVMRDIDRAASPGVLSMVYQPIYNFAFERLDGFESLSRFDTEPRRPPDVWFAEAAAVGRQAELESLAIGHALLALDVLPDDVYIAVNASPRTIVEGHLARLIQGRAASRVMVEITEHEAVEHYGELSQALAPLRQQGLRLAIDDTGAGYASFRHILNLEPNVIKLDVSITRDIHLDPTRHALAHAISGFAQATGIRLVAEGVESAAEWEVLRRLGFNKAQGYFLGRPMPLSDAVRLAAEKSFRPSGLLQRQPETSPL